uniref:Uncharacterized protein n=1 Tax=Anguilla anguilla TaxID=7936 RepID=A0A0E9VYC4_ANGAN
MLQASPCSMTTTLPRTNLVGNYCTPTLNSQKTTYT